MINCSPYQPLGSIFNLDTKRVDLHAPVDSDRCRNIKIQEMSKIELVEEGTTFPSDGASSQFPLPSTSKKVTKETNSRFKDFCFTIQKVLKNLVHTFPYMITKVHQIQAHIYSRKAGSSQFCMLNTPSDSSFSRRIAFSRECFNQVSDFVNTQYTHIWAKTVRNEIQQQELAKLTVRCAVHTNSEIGQYYISAEAVKGFKF